MTEAAHYNVINILHNGDYRKIAKVKSRFKSWEDAWKNLSTKGKIDPEKELTRLKDNGVSLILYDDPLYPKLLQEISYPPFGIYIKGKLPNDSSLSLAIVGTRKATYDGKEAAKKFARELAERDFVIVSGLALGIDAASHEGCLEAKGITVAVLANGLDNIYPKTNERLAKRILESDGAIISEYPLGAESFPYRFLERNRIVSGLSQGTLIVEAPERSGSLATARFALEQNRDVFVIPGPTIHPNFRGSHQLIRAGAELVTGPHEILEAFGIETERKEANLARLDSDEERKIVEAILKTSEPVAVDKLVESTNLNISEVNRALTFLIMKNVVKEVGDGYTIM